MLNSMTKNRMIVIASLFYLTGCGETVSNNTTKSQPSSGAHSITFNSNSTSVNYDGSITLSWASGDADSCVASDDWSGDKSTTGSEVISSLTVDSSFVLTCTGNSSSGSATDTIIVSVAPPGSPTIDQPANPSTSIPGIVEAEDYVGFFDTTPGNEGITYREDDVDIQVAMDMSNEFNIGWTAYQEWLEYPIDIQQAGTYQVQARVASEAGNGAFTLLINNIAISNTIQIDSTGGLQTWETIVFNTTELTAGNHTLRVFINSGGFNFNWLGFDLAMQPEPTPEPETDTDQDGLADNQDDCPNEAGPASNNGCPLPPQPPSNGSELYTAQCLGCHGNEQGEEVNFGGALTAFDCGDCSDLNTLISRIVDTMPVSGPAQCGTDCATAVAGYILESFDGYGEELSGGQLYEGMCLSCHGDGSQSTGLTGPQLVPVSCLSCETPEILAQRITATMPFNDTNACVGQCATDIADYIFATFEGYGVIDTTVNNLAAPQGFAINSTSTGNTLTWNELTVEPDYWIIDRWNQNDAAWENIARVDGANMTYVDASSNTSHYRLYAVTGDIASIPAYHIPTMYTIRATGEDLWNTSDSGHFSHVSVTGDFTAEITVDSLDAVHVWTKSGLMVRESLAANSRHAFLFTTGANGVNFSKRLETDGLSTRVAGPDLSYPIRFRTQRSGNTISHFYHDGSGWQALGNETLDLGNEVYVGIAVSSKIATEFTTVKISNFNVNNIPVTEITETNFSAAESIVEYNTGSELDNSTVSITPFVTLQPLVHLSRFEHENMLNDKVGAERFAFNLNADDTRSGFEVGISTSVLGVEKYQVAAEVFAQSLVGDFTLDCNPGQSASCLNEHIVEHAPDYIRRPASQALIDQLSDVFNDVAGKLDSDQGIIAIHETLAQSPGFLYKFDATGTGMDPGTIVPITGYEMASRLAFMLWGGGPDDELLEAAASGNLVTPAQIKAQATRMAEDTKAHRGFRQFYRQWFELDALTTLDKTVPGVVFDVNLAEEMLAASDAFVDEIVFSGNYAGTLTSLLTEPIVGNSEALAVITGVDATENGIHVVATTQTANNRRSGILGQPALLATLAHAESTSVILRGAFINKQLLCAGFPPPPDVVPPLDSIDPEGKRARDIVGELTSPDACAGCHKLINPFGYAMEDFDAIGRFRTIEDQGLSVDATADIVSRQTGLVEAYVDGLDELNRHLDTLDTVKACFATQYLTYGIGHIPTSRERSSVNWLIEQMNDKNWKITDLLIEATQTPVFLYKQVN